MVILVQKQGSPTVSTSLKLPQKRTQVSVVTNTINTNTVASNTRSSFVPFPRQIVAVLRKIKKKTNQPNHKTPPVEKKLKLCYFLLNILSVCEGFLSYSLLQFCPVSATWVVLLFYPVCIVNKQIKRTCRGLGAGWRTLWIYLLYLFLFKCLCFLVTIRICFYSLLNRSRIYICCLNSCAGRILLGPILQ